MGPTGLDVAWTGKSSTISAPASQEITVDLAQYFTSDRPLTFVATQTDSIRTAIEGSILRITPSPGFIGERAITVYAYDGESVLRQRFKIIVGETLAVEAAGSAAQSAAAPQQAASLGKIERELEAAFADKTEADAIIILKESAPFAFSATANKQLRQQLLEQRKQRIDQMQGAFTEKVEGNAITGAAITENDLEITREYDTVNALAARLTRTGLEALRNDPAVERVLLDRQFIAFRAQSIPLVSADDAWQMQGNNSNLTGAGEAVCIIDTGLDLTHPAFTGKILTGHDFYNNDADPQDDNSHGTHVAGIALGNDSTKGAAPDANVVPVKVCSSTGSCSGSAILAGIDYCNNNSVLYNVTAISGSLGDGGQYTSANCPSLFESALNTSVALGIIPVFASGNNYFTGGVSYPACSQFAISVGSVSKSDSVESYANRGGDRTDIFAPGTGIVSTFIGGNGTMSGTSMATPHISGIIALIQQSQKAQGKPILTLAEMRQLLRETGRQVGSWHRADAYAALVRLQQNFSINLTDNSVTNTTPPKAKIKFKDSTDFSGFVNCSRLKHNFVHVDSENCAQFNKSAHIVLEGLAGINAAPLRNGEPCPPDVCQNATFANGTLEFDVIGFSNYSGNSSFDIVDFVAGCAVINQTTSLTANISSAAGCMVINASNLALNCSGYSITYAQGGTGSAIAAEGKTNVTVQDCVLIGANESAGAALRFSNANDSRILNTTIQANGAPWAEFIDVHLSNASALTFITPNGSILFTQLPVILGTHTIGASALNISHNRAFVNSTNLSFLNASARVTLSSIAFADPTPLTDFDDDGAFNDCPAAVCAEISFANGTFVFTVTQFTAHSSGETPAYNVSNLSITKLDTPDPVENNTQLNYTIIVRSTGNGTAFNVTLTENYSQNVIFAGAQPLPENGTNATFVLGNLAPGTNITLNITVTVGNVTNQTALNNTVNASFQNETSQAFVNRTAHSFTATVNYSGIQPSPPPPPPPASSGSSGSSGGGGGDSKPKKSESSPQPQPAPAASPAQSVLSRMQTLQTTRNQQAQQPKAAPEEVIAPETEAPALSAEVAEASLAEERENAIKAAQQKKLFAYLFYSTTFSLLVALTIYWFAMHHRKPAP
jgi:subtilisin family serine protease